MAVFFTYVTAMLLGLAVLSPVKMASTLGCCAADSSCQSEVESFEADTAVPPHTAQHRTAQQHNTSDRFEWHGGEQIKDCKVQYGGVKALQDGGFAPC